MRPDWLELEVQALVDWEGLARRLAEEFRVDRLIARLKRGCRR